MNETQKTLLAIAGTVLMLTVLASQCTDTKAVQEQNEALKEYSTTQ